MRDQESTELPEVNTLVRQRIKFDFGWQKRFLLIYFLAITVIFIYSPEEFAAITVFPSWAWCVLGFTFMVRIPLKKWLSNLKFALIAVIPVLMLTSEEFWAPLRGVLNSADTAEPWITSLNCAGGMIEAAEEAVATGSPIILLQESPSRKDLQILAEKEGYRVDWGIDASVLTKFEDQQKSDEPIVIKEQNFTLVAIDNDIVIVSLRLQPPIFRLDLWNPECWTSQTQNLRSRKDELRKVIKLVRATASTMGSIDFDPLIIVGGDFNAIPSQLRVEPYQLMDYGDSMGVGWIGTAVNDFPLARIDRVWSNGMDTEVSKLLVKKTKNSDHRMVIVYR